MRIINPSTKFIDDSLVSRDEHIARCARVCYASDKTTDNEIFVESLIKKGHLSTLRHATYYYLLPYKYIDNDIWKQLFNSPYVRWTSKPLSNTFFVAINGQTYHETCGNLAPYDKYLVSKGYLKDQYPEVLREIGRYTFEIVTQLSTTRELNRVSPNNICEQSTRYCNYSTAKFDGKVAICLPHWFSTKFADNTYITDGEDYLDYLVDPETDEVICKATELPFTEFYYFLYTRQAIKGYHELLRLKMPPQDARGCLPLDVATKVVYTYFVDEWKHICDLRVLGTTGIPHPNAKKVIEPIYNFIKENRYL